MSFTKGGIPWNKGKKGFHHSEKTKRTMSEVKKGKKRTPCSEAIKKKISEAHKGKHYPLLSEVMRGKKLSEETKKKISEANRGKHPFKGKHHTEETKRKISLSHGGNGTIKNKEYRNWSKHLHRERKRTAEGSHTYGEWELLKKQYRYICPSCGKKEPKIKLGEDHIIPLSKGGSNWIENIQPLCKNCNYKKHTKIIKY